jgi:hypothetical protein
LGAPTFTEWAQTVLHITAETDWLLEGSGFELSDQPRWEPFSLPIDI